MSKIEKIAVGHLPTEFGDFEAYAFKSMTNGVEYLALLKGEVKKEMLVRIHSECLTGDALKSLRCDCGAQLEESMQVIQKEKSGILIYLRDQEGRGIGLANKIKAYALQDKGLDTVRANEMLGFKGDLRDYEIAAQILKFMGVEQVRLLTNNPKKIEGLKDHGFKSIKRVGLQIKINPHNEFYLATKKNKMGHWLK